MISGAGEVWESYGGLQTCINGQWSGCVALPEVVPIQGVCHPGNVQPSYDDENYNDSDEDLNCPMFGIHECIYNDQTGGQWDQTHCPNNPNFGCPTGTRIECWGADWPDDFPGCFPGPFSVYYDENAQPMPGVGGNGSMRCENNKWSSCLCGENECMDGDTRALDCGTPKNAICVGGIFVGTCNDVVSCSLSSVTATPSAVVPQKTTGNKNANIAVTLANPAPADGCKGRLRMEPVEFSGGHKHSENRQDHTGQLSANPITFSEGEIQSSASFTYTSGEVGGQELIIAELLDNSGSVISTATTTIDVQVPGLQPMETFFFYLPPMLSPYELTGNDQEATMIHPLNHYGTGSTLTNVGNLADAFYIKNFARLGINDISLERGGLFDICGTWNPSDTCPNQLKGGHKSHRKGAGVDINRCALSMIPNGSSSKTCVTSYNILGDPVEHVCEKAGYVCVPRLSIQLFCKEYGNAKLDKEDTYHCEFTK